MIAGLNHFQIVVGALGQKSTVWLNGEIVLEAEPGQDGNGEDGGAGFSGGGGYGDMADGGGGDGGSDGQDGQDGATGEAGKGSGVDVNSFVMNGFALT